MRPSRIVNPVREWMFFREAPAGSGEFVVDHRVQVPRVTEGVRGNSAAELNLRWEADPETRELSETLIRIRYNPNVRCCVGEIPPAGSGFDEITFIAHGYLDVAQLRFRGDVQNSAFVRKLVLRDVLQRTSRMHGAHVYGRWLLSTEGWEYARDNPEVEVLQLILWPDVAKHVEALPCVFNPKGKPNRMPRAVALDKGEEDPVWTEGPIHLFTGDDDPAAEYWTYLQALRYVAALYLLYGPYDKVSPALLFAEALAGPDGNEWWKLDEPDVVLAGAYPNGWKERMTRRCQSLSVEGMSVLEAMAAIADAAGIDFYEEHVNACEGDVVRVATRLQFVAPGMREADTLRLERNGSHFRTNNTLRFPSEIFDNNNVNQGESALEFGNAVNRVDVLGDREWRTVVAELKPLWLPDDLWDWNPPTDPDGLRDDAYRFAGANFASDPAGDFFKKFHAHGEDFKDGQNSIVGRLWGIDPAGEFSAADYTRNAPYGEGVYGDPFAIPGVPDQVPRRRRIRGVPTEEGRADIGVALEANFGGEAPGGWFRVNSEFRVLPELAAIYVTAPDILHFLSTVLTTQTDEFGVAWGEALEIDNCYDAYLQGKLKLRAVFQIELDERLHEVATTTESPVANAAAVFMRERDFQIDVADSEVPAYIIDGAETRDDYAAAEEFAKLALVQRAPGTWSGKFEIPWIEIDRYPIGTPIMGIIREQFGSVEILFGGSKTRSGFFPQVIQRTWSQTDAGISTQLVLQDYRLAKHRAPRE